MDTDLIKEMIQREIDLGYGDSRLRFILNWIKSGRPLFESDKNYLEKRLVHYPQRETNHTEEFERRPTAALESQINRIRERTRLEAQTVGDFHGQRSSISDISPIGEEISMHHVEELVAMRKNLHRILVKLDHLEEESGQEDTYQGPNFEKKSDERQPPIDQSKEKPVEGKDKADQRPKGGNEERGLHVFAVVLFIITAITMSTPFVALAIFSTPLGSEKMGEYGITYNQIKPMFDFIVPAFTMNLGVWLIFGIMYIKKNRTDQNK